MGKVWVNWMCMLISYYLSNISRDLNCLFFGFFGIWESNRRCKHECRIRTKGTRITSPLNFHVLHEQKPSHHTNQMSTLKWPALHSFLGGGTSQTVKGEVLLASGARLPTYTVVYWGLFSGASLFAASLTSSAKEKKFKKEKKKRKREKAQKWIKLSIGVN